MSFSSGFSAGFGAFEGRRQFNEKLSTQKDQFNRTFAETQRVNDSKIDLNTATLAKIKVATRGLEQANELRDRTMEDSVRLSRANADLADEQVTAAQLTNERSRRTQESTIAATNATNAKKAYDADLDVALKRGGMSDQMLSHFETLSDDEIAADPGLLSRFFGTVSGSSRFTGEGLAEDDLVMPRPVSVNGQTMYQNMISKGQGGGFEVERDENGKPVLYSQEDVADMVAELRGGLNQKAELAGLGNARTEKVARHLGTLGYGGPTSAPQATASGPLPEEVDPLKERMTELQSKREWVQSQIDDRQKAVEKLASYGTVDLKPYVAEIQKLNAQAEQLDAELSDTTAQLENLTAPKPAPADNSAGGFRTLGMATAVRNAERLAGETWGADDITNFAATGRKGTSPSDVAKASGDRMEDLTKLITNSAAIVVSDKQGNPVERKLPNSLGRDAAAQILELKKTDPYVAAITQPGNEHLLVPLVQNAVAATNGGKLPLVISPAITKAMETVAAADLGRVAYQMAIADGREKDDLSKPEVEQLYLRAATVLNNRKATGPLTEDEVKALAGKARVNRTLGDAG